jgi:hypothetical protein
MRKLLEGGRRKAEFLEIWKLEAGKKELKTIFYVCPKSLTLQSKKPA